MSLVTGDSDASSLRKPPPSKKRNAHVQATDKGWDAWRKGPKVGIRYTDSHPKTASALHPSVFHKHTVHSTFRLFHFLVRRSSGPCFSLGKTVRTQIVGQTAFLLEEYDWVVNLTIVAESIETLHVYLNIFVPSNASIGMLPEYCRPAL